MRFPSEKGREGGGGDENFRQKSSNKGRACVRYNKRNANITSIMRGQFSVARSFLLHSALLSSLSQSPAVSWLSREALDVPLPMLLAIE